MKKSLSNVFNKVANAAGGKDLVDYAGTKIAQRKSPTLSIPQTTSGKDAAKSGGRVAGTLASLLVGGGAGGIARTALKRRPKTFRIPGNKPIKISHGGRGSEVSLRKTFDEGGW